MSMSRLMFIDQVRFGVALWALVLAFSWRRGCFFFLGTACATLTAWVFVQSTLESSGALSRAAWESGHFGYSAGLVGLGLASFPEKFRWRTLALFCAISSVLTIAMDQWMRGSMLPMLSLPYVATLWLAQLSRAPKINLSWEPKGAFGSQIRGPERTQRRPERLPQVRKTEQEVA
jgi:urea transporter